MSFSVTKAGLSAPNTAQSVQRQVVQV